MKFWNISDFLQKRSNNIPFTWWHRKSNKADNNWRNIVDFLPLFHAEWGLQKLTKGGGGEIFHKNGRG